MSRRLEEVVKEAISEYCAYLVSVKGNVPLSFGKVMQELRESLAEREKHIMMATVRPDLDVILRNTAGSYVLCSCRGELQTVEQIALHWQSGHFDIVAPITVSDP